MGYSTYRVLKDKMRIKQIYLSFIVIFIHIFCVSFLYSEPVKPIKWALLKKLKEENRIPSELKVIENKFIALPGYMVALHTNEIGVRTFLLVPVAGQCIHLPPPPSNQMVYVEMEDNKTATFTEEAILVKGNLFIQQSKNKYGQALYTIRAKSILVY